MSKSQTKNRVYFWEDFSAKNLRETSVGRKGLSLFKLKDMDIPVPEFFVISPTVFKDMLFESLDRDIDKLTHKGRNPEEDEIEKSILKTNLKEDLIDQIRTAYTRISGFTDAWVSVRSSVVFPSKPEVSFSGVFSTELNVRHMDQLIDAVKHTYASVFTDDVVMYCARKGIDLSEVKLAVVVQRMVQAEVSGVVFTVDPITQDKTRVSIEAVYGLGDVIATGEITPDTYVLNKKDLTTIEKHISPQEWMRVRTVGVGKKKSAVEKISISQAWSHRQKVEEKYLQEVSKIALVIENKSREHQSIEWVQAGGRIWVLQSKSLSEMFIQPEVVVVREDRDTIGEVVNSFVGRYRDVDSIEEKAFDGAKKLVQKQKHEFDGHVEKLINIAKTVDKNSSETETRVQTREDFLLSGIGASFGTVTGKVLIVDDGRKEIKVTKNDVLVIKSYAYEMESMILSAGAVVTDTGGLTSDIAIICREFRIPAVVGAVNASSTLKQGDLVRVDGNVGSVYKETDPSISNGFKEEKVHPVVAAYSEENLSGIDLLNEKKKKEPKSEEKELDESIPVDSTLSPSATKVFVQPVLKLEEIRKYVGNSHGMVFVDMDRIMIEQGRHLLAYVEDKKFVEYAKLISEKICEYVDLSQGNEVVVSIGSSTVGEFREITKGKSMEKSDIPDDQFGLQHYVSNGDLLKRTLKIVKRVRDVYKKRNVSLAVHAPMSGDLMRVFKKNLSSVGLRRSSTFKVYAIIDNPAEVILVDDIIEAKIDGVILNMPRLARQMQGLGRDDVKAKYSLSTNSMLKMVSNVIDILKPFKAVVTVICEEDKQLVSECVKNGVYGISVKPEIVKDVRKLVAKEEAKLIMGK
ncbi:hypothetical protein K8R14_03635 [bacterium]|nr:hypothetical protein [bacterium]